MDYLNDIDKIITILATVGMVVSWLVAFLKARKDKRTLAESITLAINTLKVEGKMANGSFAPDLIAKAEAAAEVLQVGEAAKAEVVKALKEGEHVNDLKIGSIRGQPIYLGSALGIGSALAAALRKIKSIRLRF